MGEDAVVVPGDGDVAGTGDRGGHGGHGVVEPRRALAAVERERGTRSAPSRSAGRALARPHTATSYGSVCARPIMVDQVASSPLTMPRLAGGHAHALDQEQLDRPLAVAGCHRGGDLLEQIVGRDVAGAVADDV